MSFIAQKIVVPEIQINKNYPDYLTLNVGGWIYCTTLATLTKFDNKIKKMFSEELKVPQDANEPIFIDRCGKHFDIILNYLRNGSVILPESEQVLAELLAEVKYYCIEEIANACLETLVKYHPVKGCGTAYVTKEKNIGQNGQLLSFLPTIKLEIKFRNSDSKAFIYNTYLFDYLNLKFKEKMLLIKVIDENKNEIAKWSFFPTCGQETNITVYNDYEGVNYNVGNSIFKKIPDLLTYNCKIKQISNYNKERIPSNLININIGGKFFTSTLNTVTHQDTMLRALFNGVLKVSSDSKEPVFIDRSGKHFDKILNYLNGGNLELPDKPQEIKELLFEAKYYCIDDIVKACEEILKEYDTIVEYYHTYCLVNDVKMIKSSATSFTLPTVVFVYYYYDGILNSLSQDEIQAFGKHFHLFDELLTGKRKYQLIKVCSQDVVAGSWMFYSKDELIKEVVYCTNNVKKLNIKFPEAEIYKGICNILQQE